MRSVQNDSLQPNDHEQDSSKPTGRQLYDNNPTATRPRAGNAVINGTHYMDIDVYQQCPCHAEKKIKFCCGKDIVGDLNDVLAKNGAGQHLAALDQLERAVKRVGPKDCLQTIKTHILISEGEIEKAKAANELFLQNSPGHYIGFHHRALILLAEENVEAAVEALQDSMDAITGNEIPISLANAFRIVGMGLYETGNLFAARAHLVYASALKGNQDRGLLQALQATWRPTAMPLLLKQDFQLQPVPAGVEWEKKYVNVFRALDRGQFRKALKFLKKIDSLYPDLPIIARGLAIVNGFMGYHDDTIAAWRRYSRLPGLEMIRAVEAEAIAQVMENDRRSESLDLKRYSFEISDIDAVNEAAILSKCLEPTDVLPQDPFEEGPGPRSNYLVLDKPRVNRAEDLSLDTVARVVGEIILYGKQTDRSARIEVITVEGDRWEAVQATIKAELGSLLVGEAKETSVLAKSAVEQQVFELEWQIPPDTSQTQHAEMLEEAKKRILREEWTKIKFGHLDSKTPEEAAKDPELQIPLHAVILTLELTPSAMYEKFNSGELVRRQLGLAELEPLAVEPADKIDSPILQLYLDYKKLTDEQLVAIQQKAMTIGNVKALSLAVNEILSRPEVDNLPYHLCYSILGHITVDDDEALAFLQQAQAKIVADGGSPGLYLVQEFEFRLQRGLTDDLVELLNRLQTHHMSEPEVEFQLVRVLDRYGIGPERGPLRNSLGAATTNATGVDPQAAAAPSTVWTPGQAPPAPAASGDSESASGLWLPD